MTVDEAMKRSDTWAKAYGDRELGPIHNDRVALLALAAEVRRLREGGGREMFVVNACVDYETQYAVAGFACKELAESFVAKCEEYEKLLDYDCGYDEFKAWQKEHPAGDDASVGATYVVVDIPFISEAPHG